jgi:hypothetical protein
MISRDLPWANDNDLTQIIYAHGTPLNRKLMQATCNFYYYAYLQTAEERGVLAQLELLLQYYLFVATLASPNVSYTVTMTRILFITATRSLE